MGAAVYQPTIKKLLQDYALQSLITETALQTTLSKEGFRIGLPQLKALVMRLSVFQEKGKFSTEKLQQFLYQSGMSMDTFFRESETQWVIHQGMDSLAASAFALPGEVDRWYALQHQQRAFGYAEISAQALKSGITVTQADIQAAYKTNSEQYQTSPKVSVAYVVLPASAPAKSSEQLSDLTYANPDSLTTAAKALSLKIQTSPLIAQSGEKQGMFSESKVLEAIFSDSVYQQGNNSDPISLPDGSQVVLRVAQKIASQPIPLTKVQDKIKAQLMDEKAQAKAGLFAFQLQKALLAGESPPEVAKQYHVIWHEKPLAVAGEKPNALTQSAFKLLPADKPLKNGLLGVTVETRDDGQRYEVIGLTKIVVPTIKKIPEKSTKMLSTQLQDVWGQAFQHCFMTGVMKEAKIHYGVGV